MAARSCARSSLAAVRLAGQRRDPIGRLVRTGNFERQHAGQAGQVSEMAAGYCVAKQALQA